ncbi:uncharacterized [Tachysurus ichikawai]
MFQLITNTPSAVQVQGLLVSHHIFLMDERQQSRAVSCVSGFPAHPITESSACFIFQPHVFSTIQQQQEEFL